VSTYRNRRPAYLILSDGTIFNGWNLGAEGTTIGEVVFATGMTGYQETLTDPGYYGQIVTQTFPLIGNYGVNDKDRESSKVWLSGYIIREWCFQPSNFRSEGDLGEYLTNAGIVGIYDIDTRALTRKLRESGVMNGAITTDFPEDFHSFLERIKNFKIVDAVEAVSFDEPKSYRVDDPVCKVVLMDYGYKKNVRRSLTNRRCDVYVMPYDSTLEQIEQIDPDGILLSNGPGDPKDNPVVIRNLRRILDETSLPVTGVGLGHELMALAYGGDTEKLKYGHHGANQPVMDVAKGRVFATAQNHGHAVVPDSIAPSVGKVSHYNVNDHSCEGIVYTRPDTFAMQFHPDDCAGPNDTQYLLDNFVSNMIRYRQEKEKEKLR